MTYTGLSALAQVEGEVAGQASPEGGPVLGVQAQDLGQPPATQLLQAAVGQGFHISAGLQHTARARPWPGIWPWLRDVCSNQVAFPCREGWRELAGQRD